MCIKLHLLNVALAILCLPLVGCTAPGNGYAPLTHTASLRNIGKQEVSDAVLFSGQVGTKWGIMPPGVAKHISRTGNDIPEYASAEWRRADGSVHKGNVRIEKPKEMDKRERYVIQIDDDNKLSLSVEMPKPIPKMQ
jgi:hypothetical protein